MTIILEKNTLIQHETHEDTHKPHLFSMVIYHLLWEKLCSLSMINKFLILDKTLIMTNNLYSRPGKIDTRRTD